MFSNTTSSAPVNDPVDLGDRVIHPVDFGKVAYPPGVSKNTPRWVWRCGCSECRDLPLPQGLHGPFKTRRAAEQDAAQLLTLRYADIGGTAN